MKTRRNVLVGFLVVVGVIAFVCCCISLFGKGFDKNNAGKQASVVWSYVNVREDHSESSEIITCLGEGHTVTRTGNTYEYTDGPNELWCEIQLDDGSIGWVVAWSIHN